MAGLSIRALLAVCSWALLGVTSAAVVGSVARNDSAVKTSTPMSLSKLTPVVQLLQISIRSLPKLIREVQTLQRANRSLSELTRMVLILQMNITSLPETRRVVQGLQRSIRYVQELTREVRTLQRTTIRGGATYVRWGRTSCPSVSKLVYRGYAGGSWWNFTGAAADYLCLPEEPQYAYYTDTVDDLSGQVYGSEYETYNALPNFLNDDQNVPCAVCRSPTRTTALMIPARTSCYPGFQLEYLGYLMAGHWNDPAASQYVCVDHQPESFASGEAHANGKVFFFVRTVCLSLRCPPYVNVRELPCVVCSK